MDADDLSQAALTLALNKTDARCGPIGPWLRGVAKHLAWRDHRDTANRARREQRAANPERVPSAMERASRLETEQKLLAYLRELPDEQAEAIYLRYWEGLSPRHISKLKDVPVGTVKTRILRGLRALRERLTESTHGGREAWLGALAGWTGVSRWESVGVVGVAVTLKKSIGFAFALVVAAGLWKLASPGTLGPVEEAAASQESSGAGPLPMEIPDGTGGRTKVAAIQQAPSTGAMLAGANGEITRSIEGVLVNMSSHSGESTAVPAAGVEVRLQWGMGIGWGWPTTVTDRQGRFRFELSGEALQEGSISVQAPADERYRSGRASIEFAPLASGDRTCEVRRYLHGTLFGTVFGTAEGVDQIPLEGVPVKAATSHMDESLPDMACWTDEHGRFQFERLDLSYRISIADDSWTVLNMEGGEKGEFGEWTDMHIVLARRSTLRVRVMDANSAPIAGAHVRVQPSPAERFGGSQFRSVASAERPITTETDHAGKAFMEGVWRDQKLVLEIHKGHQKWSVDRQSSLDEHPGRAIVAGGESGPLVTVILGVPRTVSGRVLSPDGRPFPDAQLCLRSVEHSLGDSSYLYTRGHSDEKGDFEIHFFGEEGMGHAQLIASDRDINYVLPAIGTTPLVASTSLRLDRDTPNVTLRLAETMEITGVVESPDGEGVLAMIELVPTEPTPRPDWLPNGLYSWGTSRSGSGAFRIRGLPPGSYGVRVIPLDSYGDQWVPNVAAGTKDIHIEVGGAASCSITIEVVAPEGVQLAHIGLQQARLLPHGGAEPALGELPAELDYRAPTGFPFYSKRQEFLVQVDAGMLRLRRSRMESKQRTFQVPVGFGGLGVSATTTDGWKLAPMGTGLVELTPGHHKLRFHLTPTGSVLGRVPLPHAPHEPVLFAAIVPRGGEPLRLDVRATHLGSYVELGATGDFVFDAVPAGSHQLWVGTMTDLKARAPALNLSIEVIPCQSNTVTFESKF